jgi:hypothetical protein
MGQPCSDNEWVTVRTLSFNDVTLQPPVSQQQRAKMLTLIGKSLS